MTTSADAASLASLVLRLREAADHDIADEPLQLEAVAAVHNSAPSQALEFRGGHVPLSHEAPRAPGPDLALQERDCLGRTEEGFVLGSRRASRATRPTRVLRSHLREGGSFV